MRPLRVGPPAGRLDGSCRVPGDKSICHRSLLLGALAEGESVIEGFPGGADVCATLDAVRRLGAQATRTGDTVRLVGAGLGLGPTGEVALDCGNSGTTMRLGAGLVAGGPGLVVLDGDASLRRRPMERIAAPLRQMGAIVETTEGRAPLRVRGGALAGIDYTLPVASAQVKSAVLLAGLRARGTTRVREPLRSRDHTERMLAHQGVRLARHDDGVSVEGGQTLRPLALTLPGDPSSAAFLAVAALLLPGSAMRVEAVDVNPTRIGAFRILGRMGASIAVEGGRDVAGEPIGDLVVRHAPLRGTAVTPEEVPDAIDELPILAVAAAFATGETRFTGAAELRVKESDRLAALEQLRPLGVAVTALPDGLVVHGDPARRLRSGRIVTGGDHRIAMAFAVAALRAEGGLVIDDPACADVSFPGFFDLLHALGAVVEPA
ncbi:MAG: 3-phosphoshikimate 1-carboxyvinyltransferase [bacterium]|nr:3-phosphoshikimate 1-carboxyvinyltransferase [bacterium]